MKFVFHKNFEKGYKKLSKKQKGKFEQRKQIFELDEFSPILNNHALAGKYHGYRSVNVTGDLRAVFYRKSKSVVIFIAIDNYSNLYK